MKQFKQKKDIIIILIFLLIAGGFLLINQLMKQDGDRVVVYVDGVVWKEYSLSEDHTYEIDTQYGKNVVKIKDHQVSITSASCENQVCVQHKAISDTTQSIICLPNHLVVKIETDNETQKNQSGEIDDIAK